MLGLLAALGAVLCMVLFVRSKDEERRTYWLGYALFAAGIFVVWMLFR